MENYREIHIDLRGPKIFFRDSQFTHVHVCSMDATGTVLLTHFTGAANRARNDIAKRQADVV